MNSTLRRPLIGIPAATYQDSTYVNLPTYRINGLYSTALAAAGAAPVAIPLGLPEETLRAIFERLDGLLLAGGVDIDPAHYGEAHHPNLGQVDALRDATELTIARWALAADLPILGICRGIQTLNVAAGGSLYQDIPAQLPTAGKHDYKVTEVPWEQPSHPVRIVPSSRLASVLGTAEIQVNSYHHQCVKRPADGLIAVAWAPDGVVEGLEGPGHRFVIGVQWHPEGMFRTDPVARRLFAAFVAAAQV